MYPLVLISVAQLASSVHHHCSKCNCSSMYIDFCLSFILLSESWYRTMAARLPADAEACYLLFCGVCTSWGRSFKFSWQAAVHSSAVVACYWISAISVGTPTALGVWMIEILQVSPHDFLSVTRVERTLTCLCSSSAASRLCYSCRLQTHVVRCVRNINGVVGHPNTSGWIYWQHWNAKRDTLFEVIRIQLMNTKPVCNCQHANKILKSLNK